MHGPLVAETRDEGPGLSGNLGSTARDDRRLAQSGPDWRSDHGLNCGAGSETHRY